MMVTSLTRYIPAESTNTKSTSYEYELRAVGNQAEMEWLSKKIYEALNGEEER